MKYSKLMMGAVALSVIALSGTTSFAGPGEKKGGHHRGGGFLEKLDTDGDGQVTVEEAQTEAAEKFAKMDADGDGLVTSEEMMANFESEKAAKMKAKFDKKFAESDTDGDGALSEEEFIENSNKRISSMDADGDGIITKEEMIAKFKGKHGGKKGRGAAADETTE